MTSRHAIDLALRPPDAQSLLRLFAAGWGKTTEEKYRYLARPFYHRMDARDITMAGDGRIFVWAFARVPGFRDYEVPPGGYGYVSIPEIINLKRHSCQVQCPAPEGPWHGNSADTVWIGQTPARIRRADLARLAVFDTCLLGPGETWLPRPEPQAFRTACFTWKYGTLNGGGVLYCGSPVAVQQRRHVLSKRARGILPAPRQRKKKNPLICVAKQK